MPHLNTLATTIVESWLSKKIFFQSRSLVHFNATLTTSGVESKYVYSRKCEDYIYVKVSEYCPRIDHYLRCENQVDKNKVLSYCEALKYMQMLIYKYNKK